MQALVEARRGVVVDPPPVWLMRQAGRYLPEYRAVRADAGGFLDLCYDPERAAEVTMQPVRRFGLDAAILFSDILVVPHALGRDVRFVENEGPRLDPLGGAHDVEAMLERAIHPHLAPVYDAVALIRARLPAETALIGFAGAPWTLACYMVEGQGSKDFARTRLLAAREPALFEQLIGILERAIVAYLERQIAAGANVVKLFDSWAGVLAPDGFERWCAAPLARITAAVKGAYPEVPVIVFPRGAGLHLRELASSLGCDGLALDTAVPTNWAAQTLPRRPTLQGNLDPVLLVAGGRALDAAVDRIRHDFQGRPHVFNLGHGVTPDTPASHVVQLLSRVRTPIQ